MKLFNKVGAEIDPLLTFYVLKILQIFGWGRIGQVVRGKILRLLGFKFGRKVSISTGVMIFQRKDPLFIGEGTFINQNVYFDAGAEIRIGKHCDIGYNSVFAGSSHQLKSEPGQNRPNIGTAPIILEDHVWIACNCTILAGVTIGKNSVIAAGSVVTKDIPPNSLAAGVPARVIREL